MLRIVTVWRAVSQLVMAIESEKAASSRCGERMRIFRLRLLVDDSICECPAGRAAYAAGGHFVAGIPVLAGDRHEALALLGFGCLFCRYVIFRLGPVGYDRVDDDVADAVGR